MNGRDLVRSVKVVGSGRAGHGLRGVRAAWRRSRADASALPRRGAERARVPGELQEAVPAPGGGTLRFARSELRVVVTAGGAVFWGWDGAGPGPSYALVDPCPEPDPRAVLEPDKDGGWRVVAERVTVAVSRHGAVRVCTPGGVTLRSDLPPRWWEPAGGGAARWMQRAEVAADARFFGLGGRAGGPRLRDGSYRLWNTDPGGAFGPGDDPLHVTMPVQVVVADAGTHLVFHDSTWDGTVTLREGSEGAGSGHDVPGRCDVRMDGGPLRCWAVVGTPARVLQTWAALTGAPVPPPAWALGHQHVLAGRPDEQEVRRVVAAYQERGLALDAVDLDGGHQEGGQAFSVDHDRFPKLPVLADELRRDGVRLVSAVDPAVRVAAGNPLFDNGAARDVFVRGAFVRGAAGRPVEGAGRFGGSVHPDFTAPSVRRWWGGLYADAYAQGFAGFRHVLDEPTSFTAYGEATLPRSAVHALEGRGGDHREAHNVYALCMARAAREALDELPSGERALLLSRSGWAGMQRFGGSWSGRVATGWAGLRASVSLVVGLGLCGVPFAGPDVGGHGGSPSGELYVRWLQLAAHLPLLRTRGGEGAGREGARLREPWEFGAEVAEHARVALAERRRLLPYLTTLAHLARLTGAPLVRPLWWGAPEDRALRDCEDAFLLGDCLLVAPVFEAGTGRRAVRLPRGRWYDTTTERAYEGPGLVQVDTPPSRIAVLAREGAVLPVSGDAGPELEVWAPSRGRPGGGTFVPEPLDGAVPPVVERFVAHRQGERVVVRQEREDGLRASPYPVRVRGLTAR